MRGRLVKRQATKQRGKLPSDLRDVCSCLTDLRLNGLKARVRTQLQQARGREGGLAPALLTQQFFYHAVTGLQRFAQLLRQGAAAFSHVGFATTLAANYRREFLYDFAGRDAAG